MNTHVILVDENDNEIGTMQKLEAHRQGVLHRAFSVFIFNSTGEMLLQQRAFDKYHSGGLWSNACCSHPLPNEDVLVAAHRRLKEEMGMQANLKYLFSFKYKCELEGGLTEHELDHVLVGISDCKPTINSQEVAAWGYFTSEYIQQDLLDYPEKYTYWFSKIINRIVPHYKTLSNISTGI